MKRFHALLSRNINQFPRAISRRSRFPLIQPRSQNFSLPPLPPPPPHDRPQEEPPEEGSYLGLSITLGLVVAWQYVENRGLKADLKARERDARVYEHDRQEAGHVFWELRRRLVERGFCADWKCAECEGSVIEREACYQERGEVQKDEDEDVDGSDLSGAGGEEAQLLG